MWVLPVVIVAQIIFATLAVNISSHPQAITSTHRSVRNVLGVYKIAQSDTTPADNIAPTDNTTAPPPAAPDTSPSDSVQETPSSTGTTTSPDQSTPAPTENSTSSNPSNTDQTTSQASPPGSPDDSEAILDQLSSAGQQPSLSPSPQPSTENVPAASTNPSSAPVEESTLQTTAVLNPDSFVSNPENISQQSISVAKDEDEKLAQVTTPEEKNTLRIEYATDKVKDLDNFLKKDDLASTTFTIIRLDEHLEGAINNLKSLPINQAAPLKKQLASFCRQADMVLKSAQLVVPEDVEQDMEISRGRCLSIQQ